jgi:hypothetical protein
MALLTLQSLSAPSLTPSYGAVSASDTVAALDDRMFLHVKNAGGSPDTVTIVIPGQRPVRFGDPGPHGVGPGDHG